MLLTEQTEAAYTAAGRAATERHRTTTGGINPTEGDQMALDENPDTPGTYLRQLAEDQQAGRLWKCQCGEPNPGTYDTCYFCQRPNLSPTIDPA
ncbi:hypothetical protein [Streptomyces sp. NPDC014676]|uniref:hypothetical protein n=1 Tax=Streptomyces sp. NPDC014676 TaxID=3364879 RepID=UPI0036FB50C1